MNAVQLRKLLQRPIAFHRVFAEITGSATSGLFLSQLFYWHDKGEDPEGWIYKTQTEWQAETYLNRYEQERARATLREMGLLEEKRQGLPAKMYYRLNIEALVTRLNAPYQFQLDDNGDPVRPKRKNSTPPQVRARIAKDQSAQEQPSKPKTSSASLVP
jgi:hypothetical protein